MKIIILLLLNLMFLHAYAQKDFSLINPRKNSFRFDLNGNLVLLPVKVNGVELSFLLDTGVKETILFATPQDSVPLENISKVKFSGIGIEDGVEGIMAVGNEFSVGNILIDSTHNIYVIDAEDLDLSSHIGVPINGILGSHLFEDYLVRVDYQKKKISVFDPLDYPEKLVKNHQKIPIELERSRPYVYIDVDLGNRNLKKAKMLVDMGNSDGMLVFPFLLDSFTVHEPNIYDFIGRGFNGLIFGKRNRIEGFEWSGFYIKEPIVSYPDSNAVHAAKLAKNRVGSIGNQVLQHFDVIFNYQQNEIFLKKNRNFGKKFEINMSGMEIKHDGLEWTKRRLATTVGKRDADNPNSGINVYNQEDFKYEFTLRPIYKIASVREGSPADSAGVKVNDELLKINGNSAQNMKLNHILGKLMHKEGEEINLVLKRGTEEVKAHFILIDPIPYRKAVNN
ncbi:hypothetical protein CHU00_12505 [Sphingobacterium cellulitidis]|uniref:PDZ domain-containing protein n=1 Tax=Sphingobacterium cellulitidis TaxID=1768011 RepID=UPI000B946393|nr:PDZ domain-containing protein [Sphingobacterium cellulitidis]OYD45236.1 hypothetical protein CHU00_12505 [Sphingobacterium cellulitidis]